MKVPLTWFALFVLLSAVLLLSWKGKEVYEAFRDSVTSPNVMSEGFEGGLGGATDSDIHLTACPSGASSFLDSAGRTLCCAGPIVGGKCSSIPLCSLSEAAEGVPPCNEYLAALLNDKGLKTCPASMPNYYEDLEASPPRKGCTAGPRTADGKGPKNPSAAFCVMYSQETDELLNLNSCTNQALSQTTKCFSRPVDGLQTTLVPNGKAPALVQCSYRDPSTSLLRTCFSDESLSRAFDYEVAKGTRTKGWRESLSAEDKLLWCSKHQKVYLDKTKSTADLKNESI